MKYSHHLLIIALSLGLLTTAASAQQGTRLVPKAETNAHAVQEQSGTRNIHVSDAILRSPEGEAALRTYLKARAEGRLPMRKTTAVDTVGSAKDFNVRTNLLETGTNEWEALSFTLRAANDVANVWVASELTGDFSGTDLERLEAYILSETPEHSYRPDRGIIQNDNDVFGDPPGGVDADGRVDILLHDIEEGEENGCCVLGYVTSQDLDPTPDPGEGNAANVLYVDLPDGIAQRDGVFGIAGTIAHEYQHLIHFAYMSPGIDELTFVNEGMSEWAEVVNGYFLRAITYLSDTSEHGTQLFTFRSGQSTSVVDKDYQRAGLFTTYIADQIGREATGRIVQAKCPSGADYCPTGQYLTGADGYQLVLNEFGLTMADVVTGFHAANLVNDRSLGDAYGYALPQRQDIQAPTTTSVDGLVESPPTDKDVNVPSGAVHYLSWTSVTDLSLDIADGPAADADNRSRASLRLLTESVDGTLDVVTLDPATRNHLLEGAYERATLMTAHIKPSDPKFSTSPLLLNVSASWSGGAEYTPETVVYDSGVKPDTLFYLLEGPDMQANAFDVPDNGRLSSVSVAPVYYNQFTNGPPEGLPRDFRLTIWADDGTGVPGETIYSQDIEESPTVTHIDFTSLEYHFLKVDMPGSDARLSDLPDRIFVGISNVGTDTNHVVLSAASNLTEANVSYLYRANQWQSFADYRSEFKNQAFPIRATFLIATANEEAPELPSAAALAQNFPNPFNPTTSISYSLPRPMRVQLSVYNLLGQRVMTIVDGLRQGGEHVAHVDASGWASGVYVYALETETQTLTRRMVILK